MYFTTSSASIVDFKQLKACWGVKNYEKKTEIKKQNEIAYPLWYLTMFFKHQYFSFQSDSNEITNEDLYTVPSLERIQDIDNLNRVGDIPGLNQENEHPPITQVT